MRRWRIEALLVPGHCGRMADWMIMDAKDFIRSNLPLLPVPAYPGIRLHKAVPSSRLGRLADREDFDTPYWAYGWGGGLALAHHLAAHPGTARGRHVLDLGSGSGIVAIAAALSGAASVVAAEVDAYAVAAIELNAEANGVSIGLMHADILGDPPPPAEIVLVGDLFYDQRLAERVTAFLLRCREGGAQILVGDPWRAYLPHAHLRLLAEYDVAETGDVANRKGAVFEFTDRRLDENPGSASKSFETHPK